MTTLGLPAFLPPNRLVQIPGPAPDPGPLLACRESGGRGQLRGVGLRLHMADSGSVWTTCYSMEHAQIFRAFWGSEPADEKSLSLHLSFK